MIAIPVLCLALLVLAFFANIPGGVRWAAIVVGLVAVQIGLALVSFGVPWIGVLHGLNAFALAGAAGRAARLATGPAAAATPASAAG
jgi:hypothetical protein